MSEKNTLLDIKDLTVEFTSDEEIVHAVNHVSLSICKGETLGLVGETGAGKTTIAKSILGILPDPPAKIRSGEIYFEGKDTLKYTEAEMRKIRGNKISMIFQDPMTALNPTIVIGKQIEEAIQLHSKTNKKEAREKTVQILEKVGIPGERYGEYPHQFSGGMKQRVVIAMALACNPELLLADEPTTALDVTIQAQVLDMMMALKKEFNTSMLLITHDLGIVAETCEAVAVIYAGEIVEFGRVEEIFDSPAHPYTLGLFGSLPDMTKSGGRLKPIKGMMPDPTHLPKGCKFAERCSFADASCFERQPELVHFSPTHFSKCIKAKEAINGNHS